MEGFKEGSKEKKNFLILLKELLQVSYLCSRSHSLALSVCLSFSLCAMCCAKSLQSWPTLCDPMTHSPPGSSVHGILQARILKNTAISYSRGSSQPRD